MPKGAAHNRSTKEEFVEKAKNIHGDRYDYSLVEYVDSKTRVGIICPIHGVFTVTPSSHLTGRVCKKCSIEKRAAGARTSIKEFIDRSNILHNFKFDYSLVHQFQIQHEKVKIICPVHGEFKQAANAHLQGYDCNKCSYEYRNTDKIVSKEEFERRLKERFGDKYLYDLDSYTKMSAPFRFKCEIHGWLEKTAKDFLTYRGCFKCFRKNEPHTTESFIEKASKVHNNLYSYPDTIYGGRNNINVDIYCRHHGSFTQTPMSHLAGGGCHVCAIISTNALGIENIEESKFLYTHIYLLKMYDEKESFYKIGLAKIMSRRDYRYKIESKYTRKMLFIQKMSLYDAANIESKIISNYKEFRHYPLQKFSGHTECFNLNLPIDEIINELNNATKRMA